VSDDPTPTITEQERTTLEERQSALAAAAAAVKDGVADYNACLAALQEVAAAIAARLRADYEAGSSAPVSRGALALITDLEAVASMTALNATLLGLTDPPPPPDPESV
jgi:ActR/RegA family two-component response regulator